MSSGAVSPEFVSQPRLVGSFYTARAAGAPSCGGKMGAAGGFVQRDIKRSQTGLGKSFFADSAVLDD